MADTRTFPRLSALVGGSAILLADALILPLPPYPFSFIRTGFPGSLFAGLLTLAGASAARRFLARGKSPEPKDASIAVVEQSPEREDAAIAVVELAACCGLAALALAPMVMASTWSIPLVSAVRSALSGSPDASVSLLFLASALVPAVLVVASPPAGRFSTWAAGAMTAAAALLPWLSLVSQAVLNQSAGMGRLALSAFLQTAALAALAYGWSRPSSLSDEVRGWLSAAFRVVPICIVLAAYFVLKLETLSYSATDENIYFYGVREVLERRLPYRDFFFAHPPLHLAVPALLAGLFGFSIPLVKLVPVLASMVSGAALFLGLAACLRGSPPGCGWPSPQGRYPAVAVQPGSAGPGGSPPVRLGRAESVPLAPVLAATFFLFAMEQLQASTNLTGINLTVMFLTVSLALALASRPVLSGVAAGLAVCTGVYAAAPALAIPAVLFYRGWRKGLAFLAAFAATAGAINLPCIAFFGNDFLVQVYGYHFLKVARTAGYVDLGEAGLAAVGLAGAAFLAALAAAGAAAARGRLRVVLVPAGLSLLALLGAFLLSVPAGSTPGAGDGGPAPAGLAALARNLLLFVEGKEFLQFLYFHTHLVLAPLLLLFAAAVAAGLSRLADLREAAGIPALAAASVVAAALAELALLRETYTFYYVLLLPGLAILLALACDAAWTHVAATAAATRWLRLAGAGAAVCFCCGLASHSAVSLAVGEERFPEEMQGAGQLVCYTLPESGGSPLSRVIREKLLPPCRMRGSTESGVYHYLWKKTRAFTRAQEIADVIRHSSAEGETVIGSSLVTPLLSLLSGRDIAAGYVDTNTKRFKAGLTDAPDAWKQVCTVRPDLGEAACRAVAAEQEMWRKVCATPVRFVIAGPASFFTPSHMATHPVIRRSFKPVGLFNEPWLTLDGKYPLVLYRRVSDAADAQGRYCTF